MNNKTKVLVIINLFNSAKIFIGDQFKYLQKNGYEMHLICSPDKELEAFALSQGIKFKALPVNRQITPKEDFKSIIEIIKYIKDHKINIIIGHQAKGILFSLISKMCTWKPKLVVFAHGTLFETSKGWKRQLFIFSDKVNSWYSSKIVCVSNYLKDLRLEMGIDKEEKQVVLGAGSCGGIDANKVFNPERLTEERTATLREKLGVSKDNFVIGFVGRLVRDKGIDELLESFKILKDRRPRKQLKLLIIGKYEERDAVGGHTKERIENTQDIIHIADHINNKDIPEYYALMSVLVLPSHREGFGMCNIEAQAMGIPVITSNYTGCKDTIINDETGYLTSGDPDDIANKIELLFDEEKRQKFSLKAREWATTNFDHSKIWPHIKKMLDEISES